MKHRFKIVTAGIFLLFVLLAPANAMAEDAALLQGEDTVLGRNQATLTGTVTEVGFYDATIDVDGVEYSASFDEMELSADVMNFLQEGDDIVVKGEVTGDSFGMPIISVSEFALPGSETGDEMVDEIINDNDEDDEEVIVID